MESYDTSISIAQYEAEKRRSQPVDTFVYSFTAHSGFSR